LRSSLNQYSVEEAISKEAGKSRLLTDRVDCAIVDFHMHDGDAFDLIREVRDAQQNFAVPLILLTGQGSEEIAVKAMKLGINDYILKDRF
jgi:DNA-binding response OmpR family regulator